MANRIMKSGYFQKGRIAHLESLPTETTTYYYCNHLHQKSYTGFVVTEGWSTRGGMDDMDKYG